MCKKVIILLIIILSYSCSSNENKILPKKRNLIESVYSSVTIQPDSMYLVYSIVAGILEKNYINEGDDVSTHQPLFQIINNTPELNTENAKLSFELAKENFNGSSAIIRSIKDEIKSAKLIFSNDSINFLRQENLWSNKIGSKITYDRTKLDYQLSLNKLRLLESKLHRTINELETTLKQAENNYKTSLIATKDYTINSKITGKVYAINKNTGELISNMEPLATLGSKNKFIIEMLVDDVDIIKVITGQKVIINLDAYKGDIFTAKVQKIYPIKDSRNQTFKVEALFDKAPDILYPGLSGEANIIISKKDMVLTLPKEYIFDTNKVKTKDSIITLSLGLQNMEFVEVLSGINEETYVYKQK